MPRAGRRQRRATTPRASQQTRILQPIRPVPRPVHMPWGQGAIVEEASYRGRYHEPSLQLLRFQDGTRAIRFCYYAQGHFQRSPLMLDVRELDALRAVLRKAPRLRGLLRKLVTD